MSQYNKTVLTHAGLELAKRANAGQAKFGITRAVTSADDWSSKTIQDIEAVTTIPNVMQQGTIMDTEEVESNNSVMGVSLCFTNKNLSAGYQIKIIGVYVKEEGQENDFLYAVTTAITPEYMPSFADKVLYRFNTQMYLVIGNAQSVNVVINEGTAVTHGQLDKYKAEVTGNLKKLENTHKEDMSRVAKSASINGGAEILPDSTGKLNLAVPAPDLSKYVSLEQLTEILQAKADVADVNKQIKAVTDLANTKANSADVYTKTETDNQINKFDLSKVKFRKQFLNGNGQTADKTWSATKDDDGTYTIDLYNDDRTASKLHDVLAQLPNKADTTTVNSQVEDAKNTAQSKLDQAKSDLTSLIDNIKNFNVDSYKGGIPSTDMNKITDAGLYGFSNAILTNSPYTGNRWGLLLVLREYDNDANNIDQFITSNGSLFWRNISLTNNRYPNWKRFADDGDVDGLKDQINTKANASDLSALNSRAVKSIGIYPNDLNFTNGQFTNWSNEMKASPDANGYALIDLTDDKSAQAAVDQLNAMLASINAVNNKVNVEGSLFRMLSAGNTWNDILGFDNGDAPALVAFQGNSGGPMNNLLGNYSAGVAFGGGDTKGFLEVSYADHNARIGGGNGGAPVWHEDIAWKSDVNDLRNQIQQLRDNQFEVQTFTDANAAANWEAQKSGKRMAIVNS